MFSFISWQQYITFLVIGLFIYYAVIGFLYFRVEIAGLFKKGKTQNSFSNISSQARKEEADNSMLFPAVHELMEELKEVIDKNYQKEELLMSLKEKMNKYPQLKETIFKVAINNFLQQELPQLDEPDLKRIWKFS